MTMGIQFDEAAFHPQRVMTVRHTWADHPLLQFGALMDLAKRLSEHGAIRAHNADAKPGTDFASAPDTHPTRLSPLETLKRIEEEKAWMALHNIQNDPIYRRFVDEILEEVRPRVEKKDPGMFGRAGWIFITSPGAVTPYHLDHENNFILQCLGRKTVHVWEPLDREVTPERALELFHGEHSRELVRYREEIDPRGHHLEFEPGVGAYMPSTAPHWVKNGDGVSVTISVTYYTQAIRDTKRLYRGNHRLRRLGIEPSPVGASPFRDRIKLAALAAAQHAKALVRERSLGVPTPAYAVDKPLS